MHLRHSSSSSSGSGGSGREVVSATPAQKVGGKEPMNNYVSIATFVRSEATNKCRFVQILGPRNEDLVAQVIQMDISMELCCAVLGWNFS